MKVIVHTSCAGTLTGTFNFVFCDKNIIIRNFLTTFIFRKISDKYWNNKKVNLTL